MAKNENVGPEIVEIIARVHLANPDWKAAAVAHEVHKMLGKTKSKNYTWPGEVCVRTWIRKIKARRSGEEEPWRLSDLSDPKQYAIPAEALPYVLRAWVYVKWKAGRPFTRREAKWASRLYPLFKDCRVLPVGEEESYELPPPKRWWNNGWPPETWQRWTEWFTDYVTLFAEEEMLSELAEYSVLWKDDRMLIELCNMGGITDEQTPEVGESMHKRWHVLTNRKVEWHQRLSHDNAVAQRYWSTIRPYTYPAPSDREYLDQLLSETEPEEEE